MARVGSLSTSSPIRRVLAGDDGSGVARADEVIE